jgi:hypothetical protein
VLPPLNIRGADQFVVKIATGFYDNPQSGRVFASFAPIFPILYLLK